MRIDSEQFRSNGRIIQLLHDLVVNEDRCNLQCAYCMRAESPFIGDRKQLPVRTYEHEIECRVDKLLERYYEYFDAPILKLSGGEVLLMENISKLINKYSEKYETVQLLTNGLLITSQFLKDVSKCRQLMFQISIDGHEYAMNSLRVKDRKQHLLLLQNIDMTVQKGFDVEIYCVLHKNNTSSIIEFADYLMQRYLGKAILTVFPVRHKAAEYYSAEASQLKSLGELIGAYQRFEHVLPPRKYLIDLLKFMSGIKGDKHQCFCPYIMMQSIDDGSVTPCPYSWVEKIGNLLSAPEELVRQFGVSPSYHLRTLEKQRAVFCKKCFTDAYVYSLYFKDEITLQELTRNKTELRRPAASQRLRILKNIFDKTVRTSIKTG